MKMKTLAVFLAVMATSLLRAADFKSGDLYYNITSSSEPYSVEVTYQSTTSDNYQGAFTQIYHSSKEFENNRYCCFSRLFFSCKHYYTKGSDRYRCKCV